MSRVLVKLSYDGAPWAGFQSQLNGSGIQDVVEKALGIVCGESVRLHAAGRTDAGVHALGQTAHFDPPEGIRLDAVQWRAALNVRLPPSVRVRNVRLVPPGFHARFDAKAKEYHYHIWCGDVLPPFLAGRAWYRRVPPDLGLLRRGLDLLRGPLDFRRLVANRGPVTRRGKILTGEQNTIRLMFGAVCERKNHRILLRFRGEGFLYKQVRLLTGSLVRMAEGREPFSWWEDLLHSPEGTKSHHCAPADGLVLAKVFYRTPPALVAPDSDFNPSPDESAS